MADTDFADAMRQAAEAFYQDLAATVTAREAARQRWRDERERARRPMRCFHLARARAAKRR